MTLFRRPTRIRGVHRASARLSPADRLLADVADEWLASNLDRRDTTLALYRSVLGTHILPLLGRCKVGAITPHHVRVAVDEWLLHLRPTSVRRVLSVLRAVLDHAVGPPTTRNPCAGVTVPARSRRRDASFPKDRRRCSVD